MIKGSSINGIFIINVTTHPLAFITEDAKTYFVEPCGLTLTAKQEEVQVGEDGGVSYIKHVYRATQRGLMEMETLRNETKEIIERFPDMKVLIVGSVKSAQAYAPEVVSPVPYPGYEKLAPNEKRSFANKFVRFDNG